jgi:hypothetical protein
MTSRDTETPTGAVREDRTDASLGELVSDVSQDLSLLLRQEIDLAKAEVKTEATKTGKAAGMLGGAGFSGYMTLLFLSIAAWWGLANVMDEGWAALIVAVVWMVATAVLYVIGRDKMRTVKPKPERTVETTKQIPDAVKGL